MWLRWKMAFAIWCLAQKDISIQSGLNILAVHHIPLFSFLSDIVNDYQWQMLQSEMLIIRNVSTCIKSTTQSLCSNQVFSEILLKQTQPHAIKRWVQYCTSMVIKVGFKGDLENWTHHQLKRFTLDWPARLRVKCSPAWNSPRVAN